MGASSRYTDTAPDLGEVSDALPRYSLNVIFSRVVWPRLFSIYEVFSRPPFISTLPLLFQLLRVRSRFVLYKHASKRPKQFKRQVPRYNLGNSRMQRGICGMRLLIHLATRVCPSLPLSVDGVSYGVLSFFRSFLFPHCHYQDPVRAPYANTQSTASSRWSREINAPSPLLSPDMQGNISQPATQGANQPNLIISA